MPSPRATIRQRQLSASRILLFVLVRDHALELIAVARASSFLPKGNRRREPVPPAHIRDVSVLTRRKVVRSC
jgi:hypothetical protein